MTASRAEPSLVVFSVHIVLDRSRSHVLVRCTLQLSPMESKSTQSRKSKQKARKKAAAASASSAASGGDIFDFSNVAPKTVVAEKPKDKAQLIPAKVCFLSFGR